MNKFKMSDLKKGLDLIKSFEVSDVNKPPLKAYADPVGIPTIGFGSIRHPDGRAVNMGDTITRAQADEYFEFECQNFIPNIQSLVKIPLNANQFGAILSFTYNLGADIDADSIAEGLGDSTLLKLLNKGDIIGAANEFAKWNKAAGKVLPGLTRRRKAEKDLFLTPEIMPGDSVPIGMPNVPNPPAVVEAGDISDIETPAWFEPFKVWIVALIAKIFGSVTPVTKPDSAVSPDHGETLAPAKTSTVSAGNGPRITKERVQEILEANGVDITKPQQLGIRGYYADTYGAKGKNDRGVYDDANILWLVDTFRTFRGNVDPVGVKVGYGFAEATKGRASLAEGVWDYQPGMHNGSVPHLAYIQAGPVEVIRDGNPPYLHKGYFGINLHRGGTNTPSSIGCITTQPVDWNLYKSTFDAALKKHGMKTFKYVLVDEMHNLRQNKLKVV